MPEACFQHGAPADGAARLQPALSLVRGAWRGRAGGWVALSERDRALSFPRQPGRACTCTSSSLCHQERLAPVLRTWSIEIRWQLQSHRCSQFHLVWCATIFLGEFRHRTAVAPFWKPGAQQAHPASCARAGLGFAPTVRSTLSRTKIDNLGDAGMIPNPPTECPRCKASWLGEAIPEHERAQHGGATRYPKLILVDDEDLDCWVAYRCHQCGHDVPRDASELERVRQR